VKIEKCFIDTIFRPPKCPSVEIESLSYGRWMILDRLEMDFGALVTEHLNERKDQTERATMRASVDKAEIRKIAAEEVAGVST
jgi:hypothetical protein